ncbi:hypothetical protein PILCRDRAFT_619 [Piloderma croceum F 1598]|uniref:Uncharacterized protein n=1 Tax=Piloderma croceum (strain F 1598) TaxID=765440 RepID=A0A0C3G583_PILCF|nr:hypothetical protein PILCRDRAFT_619 [Piloderma croceum F 1598]
MNLKTSAGPYDTRLRMSVLQRYQMRFSHCLKLQLTRFEKSHGAFWTYGPSKAALNYITSVLAVATPAVRVVSICPGLVSTALTSHAAKGAKPEDAAQFIVDTALEESGPSPAYFNKEGKIEW